MKINIETVPHHTHRYETVGDFWYDDQGTLQVRVSEMGNTLYETMVAVHEIVEECLTRHKGIPEQQITEFDLDFESKRQEGNIDEPGFDNNCPYLSEHTLATAVELMMCSHAGLSWKDYDNTVNSL